MFGERGVHNVAMSSKKILDNDSPVASTWGQILRQQPIRSRNVGGIHDERVPKGDSVPILVVECGNDGVGVFDDALPSQKVPTKASLAPGNRTTGQ